VAVDVLVEHVALEGGGLVGEPLDGGHRDAHAGGAHGVAGAAGGDIRVGEGGPAEGAVDEGGAVVGDDELAVGGELAETNREAGGAAVALPEVLLEPHLEHAEGVEAGDVRDGEEVADLVFGDVTAGEPEPRGAEAGALPADELLEIEVHAEVEQAGVDGAAFIAAGDVAPDFRGVAAEKLDALVFEHGAEAGAVTEEAVAFEPADKRTGIGGLVFENVLLGEERAREERAGSEQGEGSADGWDHGLVG